MAALLPATVESLAADNPGHAAAVGARSWGSSSLGGHAGNGKIPFASSKGSWKSPFFCAAALRAAGLFSRPAGKCNFSRYFGLIYAQTGAARGAG